MKSAGLISYPNYNFS